jgi:hypothetical protein
VRHLSEIDIVPEIWPEIGIEAIYMLKVPVEIATELADPAANVDRRPEIADEWLTQQIRHLAGVLWKFANTVS